MTINFKKAFTVFFIALGAFTVAGIFMGAWGGIADSSIADSRLLERLLLTGFRDRLFTDPLVAFRNIGYLFLGVFHGLLALWVAADCKKQHKRSKGLWTVFTLATGLVGWLAYLIARPNTLSHQEADTCLL